MTITERQLHIATQYLATAGKNYVVPKEDDSHTNIGWITDREIFQSRPLSNGDYIEFKPCDMVLKWKGSSTSGTFNLIGSTHGEVLMWLDIMAKSNGLGAFVFDLHYSIESGEIKEDFVFSQIDKNFCQDLSGLRSLAKSTCVQALQNLKLHGEVRTWPHHFDTGTFVQLPNSDVGIGFGMAIPDSVSSDYYLYTTGYNGHHALSSKNMPELSKGEWGDDMWKGALLSVNKLESSEWLEFFEESIKAIIAL